MLIYKKGYLLFCNLNEPEKVIKQVKIQGLCGKINALARLLRLEPRCAIALDNENSDFCDVVRPYDLNDIIAYDGKYTSNFEVMTSNVTSAKSENSLEKQINEFLKNKEKEEIEKEQYKNVFYNDFQQKNICKRK